MVINSFDCGYVVEDLRLLKSSVVDMGSGSNRARSFWRRAARVVRGCSHGLTLGKGQTRGDSFRHLGKLICIVCTARVVTPIKPWIDQVDNLLDLVQFMNKGM